MLFRVWCEDKNEWEKDEVRIDACGNQYHRKTCLHDWMYVRSDSHIVEFSTRLQDVDGKEIFQGDIVEGTIHSNLTHSVLRCVVAWDEAGACFECRDYVSNTDDEYWARNVKFSKDIRVVSNIHETELTDDMKLWIKEK